MTSKNEVLERAKKCGAHVTNEGGTIIFSGPAFDKYNAALEEKHQAKINKMACSMKASDLFAQEREDAIEKHQAKIAMLIDLLKRASKSIGAFCGDQGWQMSDMNTMDDIDATVLATQQSSDAFIAEVRAKAVRDYIEAKKLNKDHSHQCRRCKMSYTPSSINEDCPACGCTDEEAKAITKDMHTKAAQPEGKEGGE